MLEKPESIYRNLQSFLPGWLKSFWMCEHIAFNSQVVALVIGPWDLNATEISFIGENPPELS